MKVVDLYARVRRACHVEGMSQRQAARLFGIDPKTVAKMLRFSVPPGYRRSKPPARAKLDGFIGVIDRILKEDQGHPRKQRHTALQNLSAVDSLNIGIAALTSGLGTDQQRRWCVNG
jgi:transcriptional regulator with XRE-family HTH domain